MTTKDVLFQRLVNQNLSGNNFKKPSEIVKWLGAVQSQDYNAAKWAISQRLNFLPDQEIEEAFNKGEILRTHVLRPTWHFVYPQDLRWMLKLTGKRVKSVMNSYNKQLGLTEEIFKKSEKIIEKSLKNNNFLTRNEIAERLKSSGITWEGNGLAHIMMWSEQNELICSGPKKGKQHTYALISERVSETKPKTQEESLFALVKMYFQSHGPAQIKDFCWWSGLTVADAKLGLELNKTEINRELIGNKTFFFFEPKSIKIPSGIYLLPNYDEYTVSYRDREALFENVDHTKLDERQNALFNNAVIISGKVEGLWRRTLSSKSVKIEFRLFKKLGGREFSKLNRALDRYSEFLKLPYETSFN